MKTRQTTNGKVEILIAEDSPTQAAQLAHLLEQHGYLVTVAANGREALALLARRKPSLVISDIVMPELDGYGLCKAIKADKNMKGIPVMLVTTLSDAQDVIRGLECGADNFLRKPYDERYLLARIDYLLMNLELRKNQNMQMGVEISLGGQRHFISSERQQILDLLISTYEQAVEISSELKQRERELTHSNEVLNGLYRIAEGLNQAGGERDVVEMALERALELPGIQAGWISLREGASGFRLAAARNLPPTLDAPGAMDGDCTCRRRLISGELDHVTNILECECLGKATDDTRGLRYHASVPLWLGDRILGVMNLVGPEKRLFDEDQLKVLYSVGHQVAVALERAHLHENLERLVEERTAALRASEARLRTIIEAEPECVMIVDSEGRLVQMNVAGLAMIEADSLEQVLGVKIVELVVPPQREAYRAFEASVLDGRSAVFEFEMVGLKGAHRWLDTHAVPLPELRDGRPKMLAITRDVTERKQAQEEILHLNAELEGRVRQRTAQLQAANQELEAFSYSVSHDLRTPLSTIDGFSRLLAKVDGNNVSEKGTHYLNRIRAGTRQMGELIEGLLSLAQLSREQIKLENVDFSAISKQVEQACREREPERQVQVHIQEGLNAHGDPRLLSAVLQNLLGNAWKFTARQAPARIDVGSELGADGDTIFFVKDNGAGFDMAFSGKLFGTFQRLHSHEDFSGTGVGLATVKRIIERHGGRVWAESKLNEGATFYFTLGRSNW
jgi:PAS domain S-box-containing protein